MSTNAILNELSPPPASLAERSEPVVRSDSAPGTRAYAELAAKLFASSEPRAVVAFASVHRGAGVTRTIRGLAAELARSGKTVAAVDSVPRPAALEDWRDRYDFVLLDCGAIHESVEILRLAPLADGVVLVVEAGRTTAAQIARAAQIVRDAQAALLGFVLNKRRYPIPGWLYRLL